MNVPAYLARIGYSGPTLPTADTLRTIHRAHLMAVPFENLDISLGRKILVAQDRFVQKIVEQHRGGFCYELNGAFAGLLEALGFRVTLLSARVPRKDGGDGPEFDHLTLRVDLDEPWLADVGFGDSFLEPLVLEPALEQKQGRQRFRIIEAGPALRLEKSELEGGWSTEYLFSLHARQMLEFSAMCDYHQTSPESPFTGKRLCSMATPEGRITLADRKLIRTRHGNRQERMLVSEDEWRDALREHFAIAI